ncbi:MAG TPA: inositol monophosphatase family protein, partial [Actinomycetota bacterium]|nr:inositol monophosphatase family protein [Actinomycetota bacterium]
ELTVKTKADLTPVTEVDRAVERAIRDRVERDRPGEAVVGEEFGAEEGDVRWIVDPIDGTKNFVRAIPVYATLIALERDGELVLGVASAPALGRRWWAARGAGAFADGHPIRVSTTDRLEDAQLCFGGLNAWRHAGRLDAFLELAGRCKRTRGFGDFWMHMLVAEGGAEIAVEPDVSLWDLAAVKVIVEEAGGRFTNLAGEARADGGSAVSTNGLVHAAVLEVLGAT